MTATDQWGVREPLHPWRVRQMAQLTGSGEDVSDEHGQHCAGCRELAIVNAVQAIERLCLDGYAFENPHPISIGVLLLRDIKKVFDAASDAKLATENILAELTKMQESPWPTIRRGEPLDARGLASRLSKYGIAPAVQTVGESKFRGYALAQLEDAWKRYVSPEVPPEEPVTSVTPVTKPAEPDSGGKGRDVVVVEDVMAIIDTLPRQYRQYRQEKT
jgi:hypothetical protein